MDKKTLRREIANIRKSAYASADLSAAQEFLKLALVGAEPPISFYWPIRTEIDPRPVMEELARSVQVALPVTSGYNPLTFRGWFPNCQMEVDGFGVAVPADTDDCLPKTLVVPMLAFDHRGHRLGYGAGHYDRTLEKLRSLHPVRAIGFAFSAQRIDEVPIEPTDQPLDLIVTENGPIVPSLLA